MNSVIDNEILINNNMIPMDKVYDICKATIKIIMKNNRIGSGFFLKFERNKKKFYCIMTNQHVIESDMVTNKEEITIKYENEKKIFTIQLDKKERIIECFNDSLQIDITIIEIIEKDNIDDSNFLLPNLKYIENNKSLINKDIQVLQYPRGKILQMAMGKITEISSENDYLLYHNADTLSGSSGSPIVLKGENTVIAIHTGAIIDKNQNVGYFIGIIIEIMNTYKKNGEGKEYYKNGKLKYEGNFRDDKYDGEGKFYDENGKIYLGQFKEGKKNGNCCIIKDNEKIKEVEFENDELINKESDAEDKDENDNNNQSENINDEQEEEDNSNNAHEDKDDSDENQKGIINKDINYENKQVKKNENSNNFHNNNANNIDNNNNNNQNLIHGIFKDAKIQFYNIFHGVGNLIGIRCRRCDHQVKSHHEIGYGKWKCQECPEDDNTCKVA